MFSSWCYPDCLLALALGWHTDRELLEGRRIVLGFCSRNKQKGLLLADRFFFLLIINGNGRKEKLIKDYYQRWIYSKCLGWAITKENWYFLKSQGGLWPIETTL
jgi:hypothetical protein